MNDAPLPLPSNSGHGDSGFPKPRPGSEAVPILPPALISDSRSANVRSATELGFSEVSPAETTTQLDALQSAVSDAFASQPSQSSIASASGAATSGSLENRSAASDSVDSSAAKGTVAPIDKAVLQRVDDSLKRLAKIEQELATGEAVGDPLVSALTKETGSPPIAATGRAPHEDSATFRPAPPSFEFSQSADPIDSGSTFVANLKHCMTEPSDSMQPPLKPTVEVIDSSVLDSADTALGNAAPAEEEVACSEGPAPADPQPKPPRTLTLNVDVKRKSTVAPNRIGNQTDLTPTRCEMEKTPSLSKTPAAAEATASIADAGPLTEALHEFDLAMNVLTPLEESAETTVATVSPLFQVTTAPPAVNEVGSDTINSQESEPETKPEPSPASKPPLNLDPVSNEPVFDVRDFSDAQGVTPNPISRSFDDPPDAYDRWGHLDSSLVTQMPADSLAEANSSQQSATVADQASDSFSAQDLANVRDASNQVPTKNLGIELATDEAETDDLTEATRDGEVETVGSGMEEDSAARREQLFLAENDQVLRLTGDDGFGVIDLKCFDISSANFLPNQIVINDGNGIHFRIEYRDIQKAVFANNCEIDLTRKR